MRVYEFCFLCVRESRHIFRTFKLGLQPSNVLAQNLYVQPKSHISVSKVLELAVASLIFFP